MLILGTVGLVYLYTKNSDSNGTTKTSPSKHPAFTYPAGQTMDDSTEDKLVTALLSHRGVNKEGSMNDGSKMSEEVYQLLLSDFNAAIAYYPNRPQKNLEKMRDDLVEYKDQLVAKTNGVGMGPIAGFGGVY